MTTKTVTTKKTYAGMTTTTIDHDLLAKLIAERDWERRHPILVFFRWLWRAL